MSKGYCFRNARVGVLYLKKNRSAKNANNFVLQDVRISENMLFEESGMFKKLYNNECIRLKTKLTPLEKRCQFVSEI